MTIDLHVHTSEVSGCGRVPAAEMVRLYSDLGYDGIVITDHLIARNRSELPLRERAAWYQTGYLAAKREGEKRGLTVLRGAEVRFIHGNEDFLLLGYGEDDLPDIMTMLDEGITEADFYAWVRETGRMLLIQAHPFRPGLGQAPLEALDGIEVYNGHPEHDSHNERAYARALKGRKGFIMTSGSDAHEVHHVGRGGMATDRPIASEDELVQWLRSHPQGVRIET